MAMPYRYFTLPGHARERHACENTFAGSPLIPRHCGARLRPLEAGLALCGTPDQGDGVRKHCGKPAALTNGEAALPIDAHPAPGINPDGRTLLQPRWQTWDSTFGVDAHSVTLPQYISPGRTLWQTYTAQPVSSFYDDPSRPRTGTPQSQNSVKTAGSGIRIDITGASADRTAYRVQLH